MAEHKGFFLYLDQYAPIEDLTLEQKGKLLEAMFAYNSGLEADILDPEVKIAFKFFKQTFERDKQRYEDKCAKLRDNAIKKQKQANATNCNQEDADASNCNQKQANGDNNKNNNKNNSKNNKKETEKEEENTVGPKDGPPPQRGFSGFTIYHQAGAMHISQRDFDSWERAYTNIDLRAELQKLSDWTKTTREWGKKEAFHACSAALAKKNGAAFEAHREQSRPSAMCAVN